MGFSVWKDHRNGIWIWDLGKNRGLKVHTKRRCRDRPEGRFLPDFGHESITTTITNYGFSFTVCGTFWENGVYLYGHALRGRGSWRLVPGFVYKLRESAVFG